jgi:hypothetical protein
MNISNFKNLVPKFRGVIEKLKNKGFIPYQIDIPILNEGISDEDFEFEYETYIEDNFRFENDLYKFFLISTIEVTNNNRDNKDVITVLLELCFFSLEELKLKEFNIDYNVDESDYEDSLENFLTNP